MSGYPPQSPRQASSPCQFHKPPWRTIGTIASRPQMPSTGYTCRPHSPRTVAILNRGSRADIVGFAIRRGAMPAQRRREVTHRHAAVCDQDKSGPWPPDRQRPPKTRLKPGSLWPEPHRALGRKPCIEAPHPLPACHHALAAHVERG